ncbi:hypothetical protein ACN9M0_00445 [Streptomyces sp. R-07]|uniref:helix-turn-helix domain-containing protein n=1 Tax=Streptomyces sp. R-07 TaxID=3404052 RepID=UPI003CF647D2
MGRPKTPLTGQGPVHTLAQRLRTLRERVGKPYHAMSGAYSVATLARADRGDRLPRWQTVLAYARACDATEQDLADLQQLWRAANHSQARARQSADDQTRFIAPAYITSVEDLHTSLQYLYLASGAPSLRELCRRDPTGRLPALSRTTAHSLLTGRRPPSLTTMLAFLARCLATADGGAHRHHDIPAWKEAWTRAQHPPTDAARPATPTPSPTTHPAPPAVPTTGRPVPMSRSAVPAHSTPAPRIRRPRTLPRPNLPPGPLKDLKTLLHDAYLTAGAPTLDTIAAAILDDDQLRGAPSRDTIRRGLATDTPIGQADTEAIAAVLADMAAWDRSSLLHQVRELWVASRTHTTPGRPIHLYDPYELGVHPITDPGSDNAFLTPYISRPHDRQLDTCIRRAMEGHSIAAFLVGPSASGKTRAVWEAANLLPQSWRLWRPWPTTESETVLAELQHLPAHTVIWLDEAQRALKGSHAEHFITTLRSVLGDPTRGPFLVLGTLWPQYAHDFTRLPSDTEPDPSPHARDLMQQATLITVHEHFTAKEHHAALTLGDERLRQAAQLTDTRVLPMLTAGPQLQSLYQTAPPATQALIKAAVDARALGADQPLPEHVLIAGASGYLGALDWDHLPDDWAHTALTHATTPVAGGLSMLHRHRHRPSATGANEPAYTLSDYLARTLTTETAHPPESLWKALADAPEVIERETLIQAARLYGRLETITPPAPAATDPTDSPLIAGARLLQTQGRLNEALTWYERAAHAGHHQAWLEAAAILSNQGRTEEALTWYEQAAHAGHSEALSHAASVLAAGGRIEEALHWYERAAAHTP